MQTKTEPWRQFWIFQTNPKQYDAKTQLTPGQTIDWYVSRFIDRYRQGDIIYLWIAGENAGIYAWAEVEGQVFKTKGTKQRLKAVYRGILKTPLNKQLLRTQPKVFDGMSILRNPTGTNFRVTVLEAIELNQLIRENGDEPPPEPDLVNDPNNSDVLFTKAVYILDYRFDKDVKRILSNCFVSCRNINQIIFPRLLIQATFIYYLNLLQQKAPPDFALMLNDVLPLSKMRSAFNFQEQIVDDITVSLSAELAEQVLVKRNVLLLLAEARRFAIKTSGKEQIMARHLIGAILQGAVAPIQSYLSAIVLEPIGYKLSELRETYVDQIKQRWPQDKIQNWRALISEELISSSEVEDTFSPLLTKIDSDSADHADVDLLNIDDDAIAISKVLCAKDAAPPIAIGLFGEWGSGKTFFMRRIHRHVKSLTERVSADNKKLNKVEQNKDYQGKVAQIWFNAWHYQDGNLWASLVNHVFDGLKGEIKRLNNNAPDILFKSLMERLDDERRMESYFKKMSVLEKEQKEIKHKTEVLKETNRAIQQSTQSETNRIEMLSKLQVYAKELEGVFEIPGAQAALVDVSNNIEQVHSIVEQISSYGMVDRVIHGFRFFTRDFKSTLLSFFFVSAVVVICYLLVRLNTNGQLGALWSGFTVVLGLLSTRLSKFSRFLNLVDKTKKDFDFAPQKSKDLRQKLIRNGRELTLLKMEKEKVAAEIKQTKDEYEQMKNKGGKDPEETFASFIADRADSSDYSSQLGLLNMVRNDFSRLNELLTVKNDVSKASGAEPPANMDEEALPQIDRIVLYIDDLDRCEPEIVVDVLQAIHLMLAFPLFMVVVGVDARWLGRSLKKRYSFLVHEKDDKNADELDVHAASTHDYLEKIFQIPFWLKRLDGERANNMMRALLKTNTKETKGFDKSVEPTNIDNASESNDDIVADFDSNLFEETEDENADFIDETEFDEILINNLISTRSLEMSEFELDFFQQLGPIVSRSPRAVKRFINLYRILKASHKKARVVGFSDESGDFKVPLFLLAIVCGSPKECEEFFIQLKLASDADSLSQLIDGFVEKDKSPGWNSLVLSLQESVAVIGELNVGLAKNWIADVARFSYREWVE